jgi:heme o synthase
MDSPGVMAGRAVTASELFGLLKPRIAFFIMLSSLAGAAISPGDLPEAWRLAALSVAVFLAAGAAGAFNQWAERDLDSRMRRTAGRPFASGRLRADGRWLVGITCLLVAAVGVAGLASNRYAALYTLLGAVTYAIVYTIWLKPRTWLNIVIGGFSGSFAVLAGAAAVDPGLSPQAVLLAIVLFLWTPPHFWSLAIAAREEYAAAAVPMLPVVVGEQICAKVILAHTLALSVIAMVPVVYGMGWPYAICAASGGLLFTATSVALVRQPGRRWAIRNFLASLVQLLLLLAGTALDRAIGGAL